MSKLQLVSSLLIFTFLLISTQAAEPHSLQFLKIHDTTPPHIEQVSSTCSYTVTINTSCSSPKFTRDDISIVFGDAYGHLVYEARMDDPPALKFLSCSTDTSQLSGPCMSYICSVYLHRAGADGWTPESVTIEGDNTQTVTYYFNMSLPDGVWYGFNHCNSPPPASPGSPRVTSCWFCVFCCLLYVLVGLCK